MKICVYRCWPIRNTQKRIKIYNQLKKLNFTLPKIISSSAIVSKRVSISEGTIIFENVLIGPDVIIGKNSIINNFCLIEHGVLSVIIPMYPQG